MIKMAGTSKFQTHCTNNFGNVQIDGRRIETKIASSPDATSTSTDSSGLITRSAPVRPKPPQVLLEVSFPIPGQNTETSMFQNHPFFDHDLLPATDWA